MKKIIKFIKELRKKPYGKAVIFFSIYFIIFVGIIIFIKTIPNSSNNPNNKKKNNKNLIAEKYAFNYNVTLDGVNYNYDGNKDKDSLTFNYNGEKYTKNGEKYYKNDDSSNIVDSPMKFEKFFIEDYVAKVLESAYFESQTTYENKTALYNFLISTNTINSILDNNNTDFSENPNRIIITINENSYKIEYQLDSYCKLNKLCNDSLKISTNYIYNN